MESSNLNLLGLIGILGALFMVIGVFLTWASLDLYLVKASWTGWDIYSDGKDVVDYYYVPLISLICGIISLVLMIVPTFMNVDKFAKINNILGIVALILAIATVICSILFMTSNDGISMEIGFWLVLIGGIITVVGGLMPIVKNKFM